MAPEYYYMWEFITSITIIVLVTAYILYDQLMIRYNKLPEAEKTRKTTRLKNLTALVLGAYALLGGVGWAGYIKTHRIFITESLMGPDVYAPAVIMAIIGLVVIARGIVKGKNCPTK